MSAWIPGSKKVEPFSSSLSGTLTSQLAKRSWERNNHRGNVPWDSPSPSPSPYPPQTPQKNFSFKRCHLRIKPRGHWLLSWQENVQFAFIKMQEAVGRERKGQRDCQ